MFTAFFFFKQQQHTRITTILTFKLYNHNPIINSKSQIINLNIISNPNITIFTFYLQNYKLKYENNTTVIYTHQNLPFNIDFNNNN